MRRHWTPFKQLFTGMNNHFYEAEAVLLLPISCFNCFNKLLFTTTQCQMTSHVTIQTLTKPNLWALFKTHAELCCPALSLTIVECIHQPSPSVVPVLDHIVWPIMDFNFMVYPPLFIRKMMLFCPQRGLANCLWTLITRDSRLYWTLNPLTTILRMLQLW